MILYKYVPQDRIDILKNKLIRFTPLNELNDPFEFRYKITAPNDVALEYILKNKKDALNKAIVERFPYLTINMLEAISHEEYKNILKKEYKEEHFQSFVPWGNIVSGIKDNISSIIGILSLSEVYDDILMWSHYAEYHKGMVIGFDINQSFQLEEQLTLLQIKYSDHLPVIRITNMEDVSKTPDLVQQAFYALKTKSQHWEYEQEWRMIAPLSILSPDKDISGLSPYNPKAIKSIIFGANVDNKFKKDVIDTISKDDTLHNITFLQAKLDSQNYKLEFAEL